MDRSTPEETQRSSLGRADAILNAFDDAHPTMSLNAIVANTGLPKTTVHRTVEKMIELGWLRRDRHRYSIGTRFFEVSLSTLPRVPLRAAARSHLEVLRAATDDTIHLAVLDGPNARYVEKLTGTWPGATRVGGRLPAHCTAVGKALLAFGPVTALDHVLRAGLAARTPTTIVGRDRLHAELARIRIDGVAYDREECEVGVACVAAPVRGPEDDCVAAISITGSASALHLDLLATAVRATAGDVSRALGARPRGR